MQIVKIRSGSEDMIWVLLCLVWRGDIGASLSDYYTNANEPRVIMVEESSYYDKKDICVGIIAYQGVKTLDNTLKSYTDTGLFAAVKKTYILFQDINSRERRTWAESVILQYPDITPIIYTHNTGHAAFLALAAQCKKDNIKATLILEEDFKVADNADVRGQLANALYMLDKGVNAVRLRSRSHPGHPHWSQITWDTTGKVEKTHLISHVFWNKKPESIPEISVCRKKPKTWCTSSKHAHYTNTPTLYLTRFLNRLYGAVPVDKVGVNSFEPWLTSFWATRNFKVAMSDAIFEHKRVDRTMYLNS